MSFKDKTFNLIGYFFKCLLFKNQLVQFVKHIGEFI